MKKTFDHALLVGRIKEKWTLEKFASQLDITPQALHNKIVGISEFRQSEIANAAEILELSDNEYPKYFFTKKVVNITTKNNAQAN